MGAEPRAIIVVDLAYGDCGKGSVVDFLTRRCKAATVVRFNGGPQAGHNVVTPDGRHHTFSQFGSGSFVSGVRTVLSRFMLIEPYALLREAQHLEAIGVQDPISRLYIDRRCVVITPCHRAANRIREMARGSVAHGTCGMGVGEAMADSIDRPALTLRAGDLADRGVVARTLKAVRELKFEQMAPAIREVGKHAGAAESVKLLMNDAWIEVAIDVYSAVATRASILEERDVHELIGGGTTVFEGAQGVLLDERHGFHPHTTWSTTTFANAETLFGEAGFQGGCTRIGVLRSYFTRHGAGPLVTEDASLKERFAEPHNHDSGWQGSFRVGRFDAVAARYALAVAGRVDFLAITHLDRLGKLPSVVCTDYEEPGSRRMGDIPIAKNPADLISRESLTSRLRNCSPIYQRADQSSPAAFAQKVEELLNVPVGIRSYGPTAAKMEMDCTCFGGEFR